MARTPVTWTALAREDLLNAVQYLAQEAKTKPAAANLLERLEAAAASLSAFPEMGRVVPEVGLPRRELIVEGYRLVYRVRSEVEILRLIHGRQDFLAAWRQGRERWRAPAHP